MASKLRLLEAYGTFWSRKVFERNSYQLWGKRRSDKPKDFSNHKGIYVLYKDFSAMYVGKHIAGRLAGRIKQHLKNSRAERWNRFSWFAVVNKPRKKHTIKVESVIGEIEKVLIATLEPPLNKLGGSNSIPEYRQFVEKEKQIGRNEIKKIAKRIDVKENHIKTFHKLFPHLEERDLADAVKNFPRLVQGDKPRRKS